jgi:hypothetical protein
MNDYRGDKNVSLYDMPTLETIKEDRFFIFNMAAFVNFVAFEKASSG